MSPTNNGGLTVVEVMIVIIILLILAMVVIPRLAGSSHEAQNSLLETNLQVARKQIVIYTLQHGGRSPATEESGEADAARIVERMTSRTTYEGKIDADGAFGPYMQVWPSNPLAPSGVDDNLKSGPGNAPRDDSSGWYYRTTNDTLHVNSIIGAELID